MRPRLPYAIALDDDVGPLQIYDRTTAEVVVEGIDYLVIVPEAARFDERFVLSEVDFTVVRL